MFRFGTACLQIPWGQYVPLSIYYGGALLPQTQDLNILASRFDPLSWAQIRVWAKTDIPPSSPKVFVKPVPQCGIVLTSLEYAKVSPIWLLRISYPLLPSMTPFLHPCLGLNISYSERPPSSWLHPPTWDYIVKLHLGFHWFFITQSTIYISSLP